MKKYLGSLIALNRGSFFVIAVLISLAVFGGIGSQTRAGSTCRCLPADIKKDSVVEVITRTTVNGLVKEKVTVRDILKKMKAKCRKGKLIDGTGKPVRFFRLRGCWGTPPENYQEILEKQEKEINELKKRNTVIEIPCNPDPMLPPAGIPR